MTDVLDREPGSRIGGRYLWFAAQRRRLERERAELRDAVRELADFVPVVATEPAKRLLVQKLHSRLAATSLALSRMDHGRYGRCERCKQAIEPELLAKEPGRRYCRPCNQ